MYVGKSHTATITSRGVRTFVCPSCSHEALAIVVGVGQGAGQSPFFLDEEGAKERASREGAKNAEENAAFTLSKLSEDGRVQRRPRSSTTAPRSTTSCRGLRRLPRGRQARLKMRHYDVQLIGGMVLHQGKIAEMRTGEGKTLVATLPAT
jgi:hypothetical protein